MAATGEKSKTWPAIHVWEISSQQNICIFQGLHKEGVGFLEFFKEDEFLATGGVNSNGSIIIYNIKDQTVLFSTHVRDTIIEINFI